MKLNNIKNIGDADKLVSNAHGKIEIIVPEKASGIIDIIVGLLKKTENFKYPTYLKSNSFACSDNDRKDVYYSGLFEAYGDGSYEKNITSFFSKTKRTLTEEELDFLEKNDFTIIFNYVDYEPNSGLFSRVEKAIVHEPDIPLGKCKKDLWAYADIKPTYKNLFKEGVFDKESIIEDLENQTPEMIYKIVEREAESLQEIFGKSIEQLLDEDFSSFKEDYFKGERIFIKKIREQNKNLELKIDNFFVSTIESANYIKRIDKFGLLKLRKKVAELAGEEVLNHYLNGEELKTLNLEKEELKILCQNYDLNTFKLDDKYRTIEKDQRAKADAIEYDITKSAKTVKRRKKKKDQGEITGVNGVLQFIYGYTHEGKLDSLACTSLYRIIENYDDDEVYARDDNNPDCLTFADFKRIVEDGIETGKGLLWD